MPKRKPASSWPPKSSYPLPDGSYALDHAGSLKNGRRIHITAKLKAEPDTEAIANALIELAKYLDKERPDENRRSSNKRSV